MTIGLLVSTLLAGLAIWIWVMFPIRFRSYFGVWPWRNKYRIQATVDENLAGQDHALGVLWGLQRHQQYKSSYNHDQKGTLSRLRSLCHLIRQREISFWATKKVAEQFGYRTRAQYRW